MSDATTPVYLVVEFNPSFFCVRGVYTSVEQAQAAHATHTARRPKVVEVCLIKTRINEPCDVVFVSDQGHGYGELMSQRNVELLPL